VVDLAGFSTDGQWLVGTNKKLELQRWSVLTGEPDGKTVAGITIKGRKQRQQKWIGNARCRSALLASQNSCISSAALSLIRAGSRLVEVQIPVRKVLITTHFRRAYALA